MGWLKPAWDYIHTGGIVMLPLVLISVILWGCIIYRLLILKQLYRKDITPAQARSCVSGRTAPPHEGQGVAVTLVRTFVSLRSRDPELDRHLLEEAATQVRSSLRQGVNLISVVYWVRCWG
ncbi:MAG: hypothetical protein LC645_05235 [Geobacteraceae bacterium]|nr:hypothetical protein [Geobacteraceae bacterium]